MTAGRLFAYATLVLPASANAHGFGALYNLPVPLWLYNWAAAATLIISFLLAALVWSAPTTLKRSANLDITDTKSVQLIGRCLPPLQLFSVFLFFLCIATGFFGNRDPMRNFSPTFFWIAFLLGFAYLTALTGNAYAVLNPFRFGAEKLGQVRPKLTSGLFQYPERFGEWPALALYLSFIAFELFGNGSPASVASFLLIYALINLTGVFLIGSTDWFRHCEFFSVFFRLIALLAPIDYRPGKPGVRGKLYLRWPCSGLIRERPSHLSILAFVLAMLSTTAFDGLTATRFWVNLFWKDPTGILEQYIGVPPVYAIAAARPWYLAWESAWLFASPFIYLAAYFAALWVAKVITRSPRPVGALALDFGYSLLPIALVYNITHYWTLLLTHGLKIFSFISDPFGWGWNIFGTAFKFRAPIIPDMSVVWHSQVGLILLGHIISVWVAHRIALRIWPSRGQALLSQLPLLILMIGLTTGGLWILAQPLTELKMR